MTSASCSGAGGPRVQVVLGLVQVDVEARGRVGEVGRRAGLDRRFEFERARSLSTETGLPARSALS